MHEKISEKLALQVAQLNYEKTVLEVQLEEERQKNAELTALLDEQTKGE